MIDPVSVGLGFLTAKLLNTAAQNLNNANNLEHHLEFSKTRSSSVGMVNAVKNKDKYLAYCRDGEFKDAPSTIKASDPLDVSFIKTLLEPISYNPTNPESYLDVMQVRHGLRNIGEPKEAPTLFELKYLVRDKDLLKMILQDCPEESRQTCVDLPLNKARDVLFADRFFMPDSKRKIEPKHIFKDICLDKNRAKLIDKLDIRSNENKNFINRYKSYASFQKALLNPGEKGLQNSINQLKGREESIIKNVGSFISFPLALMDKDILKKSQFITDAHKKTLTSAWYELAYPMLENMIYCPEYIERTYDILKDIEEPLCPLETEKKCEDPKFKELTGLMMSYFAKYQMPKIMDNEFEKFNYVNSTVDNLTGKENFSKGSQDDIKHALIDPSLNLSSQTMLAKYAYDSGFRQKYYLKTNDGNHSHTAKSLLMADAGIAVDLISTMLTSDDYLSQDVQDGINGLENCALIINRWSKAECGEDYSVYRTQKQNSLDGIKRTQDRNKYFKWIGAGLTAASLAFTAYEIGNLIHNIAMPHTTVPGTGSTPVDPGYAAHNAPDYMPDGADVAGTSHHDFNADGGGVHDVTGDYTGTDVGFAGGDIALTHEDTNKVSNFLHYLKHDYAPHWVKNLGVQSAMNVTTKSMEALQKKLVKGEKVSKSDYLKSLWTGLWQAPIQALAVTSLGEVCEKAGVFQGGQQQLDRMKKLDVLYTQHGFNNFFDEAMHKVKTGDLLRNQASLEIGSAALLSVTGLLSNLIFKPKSVTESLEKGKEIIKSHNKYLSMLDSIGTNSSDKKKLALIKENLSKAISSNNYKKTNELNNEYKELFAKTVNSAPKKIH